MTNKLFPYADTATIDKAKLRDTTEKSPLLSYADKFPKTAREFEGYALMAQNLELIRITHAETNSRDWGYIAQVDFRVTDEFFGIVLGAESHGTYYHAYEKAGGCGYDKHNNTAFNLFRKIGIEPYGKNGGHGGIYGGHASGSRRILESIANCLYAEHGIDCHVVRV